MSIGIALWSAMHLLTNSDSSSVVLFSSFLIYAFISVLVAEIRKKDQKVSSPKIAFDILVLIIGIVLTVLAYNFHGFLSGIDLIWKF